MKLYKLNRIVSSADLLIYLRASTNKYIEIQIQHKIQDKKIYSLPFAFLSKTRAFQKRKEESREWNLIKITKLQGP